MTVPVAFLCLFVLPDYPSTTKAWYLTEEDRQMALRRSANAGKKEVGGHLNWALLKRMLGTWKWWGLVGCESYLSSSLAPSNLTLTPGPAAPPPQSLHLLRDLVRHDRFFHSLGAALTFLLLPFLAPDARPTPVSFAPGLQPS